MKNRIIQGDALEVLRTMPDESVHCCVTSPPYWGLRDYGVPGQLGLERTPEEYTAKMVEIFREVRRVLKNDGTLWLNLGDCYATGAGKVGNCPGGGEQGERWKSYGPARAQVPDGKNPDAGVPTFQPNRMPIAGLKPKDLVGIPWRIAFALQADGWWLRQDITWSKDNPMPESVRDRFCKSHEYIFLLSKSGRYYFDLDSILEPCESGPSDLRKMDEQQDRIGGKHKELIDPLSKASSVTNIGKKRSVGGRRSGNVERKYGEAVNRDGSHLGRSVPWEGMVRTPRSVWRINTEPCREAHFAVMPTRLVERCILAGCPPAGTVLDPFMGSGTTAVVARKLNRNYTGIELNGKYIEIAERRIEREVGLLLDCGDCPGGPIDRDGVEVEEAGKGQKMFKCFEGKE